MITIILTVSRFDYLEKVITAVELLECDKDTTNILCIVDGEDDLFLRTRNLVNDTKFAERLTVKADVPGERSNLDVPTRRARISAIHNQARKLVRHDKGYVLSVEDDTTFAPDALKKLMQVANNQRAVGIVEGVEVGRWGVPYIGAWLADDIYEPKQLKSIENIDDYSELTEPSRIDGAGLYFALIRASLYKHHNFYCDNGLGPDINFALDIRQQGFENFIVWQAPCVHHNKVMGNYVTYSPKDKTKIVTMLKKNDVKWEVYY